MTDKTVYNHLIERWSADKSKAPSTLSDMLPMSDEDRQYLLTDYVYNTLRNMSIGGDIICSVNEHKCIYVYEDKTCGIVADNHALTASTITRLNALRIVKVLPSIEQIRADIRTARAAKIPELPQTAIAFIKSNVFASNDGEYLLPVYSRERLSNVFTNMVYRGVSVDMDYHQKTLKDIAIQIRNEITRKKLIKESLPKNSEIPIQNLLVEILNEWKGKPDKEQFYKNIGF